MPPASAMPMPAADVSSRDREWEEDRMYLLLMSWLQNRRTAREAGQELPPMPAELAALLKLGDGSSPVDA